jgi:glycerol-3-phosphate dehydrogenase
VTTAAAAPPSRGERLHALGERPFDLVVIGGGITGAGVAREAALRGLACALVERRDFAYGSSSRSTKLIHGGLRYLRQGDFKLVAEAVRERQLLLDMAPHLVKQLPFAFPVYRGDPDGLPLLRLGLTLYDAFAGRKATHHRPLRPDALVERVPMLERRGLVGGAIYSDCRTDDARLTLEVVQSAMEAGALALNYAEAVAFDHDGSGRLTAVLVRDALSGEEVRVTGRRVLAAVGPWGDIVRRLDAPAAEGMLRRTRGVHLCVPWQRLPLPCAVIMRGRDGRLMFAVPTPGYTYVGTTDTEYDGDPDQAPVTAADAAYVLEATNRTFPRAAITPGDVVSTWSGVRPLVRPRRARGPSAISRDYVLLPAPSGLVTVGGGKLTAFRAMAVSILDRLFPATRRAAHASSQASLPGAPGPDAALVAEAALRSGLGQEEAQRLAEPYGGRFSDLASAIEPTSQGDDARLAWYRAMVGHAVRHEMAETLEDVVLRRTPIMLFSQGNGGPYLARFAADMAALRGWPAARAEREAETCRERVDAMFAWRDESV